MAISPLRSKDNRLPFETVELPCSLIHVDELYQRSLNPRRVRQMLPFDPGLAGAINVNRRQDGTYWVFDGQHRLEAARQSGVHAIYCHVYTFRTEREAEWFVAMNGSQVTVGKLEQFKARLRYGEARAKEIEAIVQDCGFDLDFARRKGGAPGRLYCVQAIEAIFVREGAEQLRVVLSLLHKAWSMHPKAGNDVFVRSLNLFLRKHGKVADLGRLVQVLGNSDPDNILARVRQLRQLGNIDSKYAALAEMERMYNYRLRSGRLGNTILSQEE